MGIRKKVKVRKFEDGVVAVSAPPTKSSSVPTKQPIPQVSYSKTRTNKRQLIYNKQRMS